MRGKDISWRFYSEYLKAKLAIYAEDEDAAWDAFRSIVQPSVASYFMLASVEGSVDQLEVRKGGASSR